MEGGVDQSGAHAVGEGSALGQGAPAGDGGDVGMGECAQQNPGAEGGEALQGEGGAGGYWERDTEGHRRWVDGDGAAAATGAPSGGRKKRRTAGSTVSKASTMLKKPVDVRVFKEDTLDVWQKLHNGDDGTGLEWSCTGNPLIGRRYRKCDDGGRKEGFLVAWAFDPEAESVGEDTLGAPHAQDKVVIEISDEARPGEAEAVQGEPRAGAGAEAAASGVQAGETQQGAAAESGARGAVAVAQTPPQVGPSSTAESREDEVAAEEEEGGGSAAGAGEQGQGVEPGSVGAGAQGEGMELDSVCGQGAATVHEGTAVGAGGASEAARERAIKWRVAYNNGDLEIVSHRNALRGIKLMAGVTISAYGFSPLFAMREALNARSAGSDVGSSKIQTMTKKNEGGTSMSYTTSETVYDLAWDAGTGDFEHVKVLGGREINGQTGIQPDTVDTYFPVMASILNHLPTTKIWFDVTDKHSGVEYKLSAITYGRREWMRSGANTRFHHGGLMVSGGWSNFRRDNDLGIGDTVVFSRKDGKLFIHGEKGCSIEVLSQLSRGHYAIKTASVQDKSLLLEEKRKKKAVQRTWETGFLWASKGKTVVKKRSKVKKENADGSDDDEPMLTLTQALRLCDGRVFLQDWWPKTKKSAVKSEPGLTYQWEENVVSEVSESDANFRYIKYCELFNDMSDWSKCQQFAKTACLMKAGYSLYYPPVSCTGCQGSGKVDPASLTEDEQQAFLDTSPSTVASTSGTNAAACDPQEPQAASSDVPVGTTGPLEQSGAESQGVDVVEQAAGQQDKFKKSAKGKSKKGEGKGNTKRKPTDMYKCKRCDGTGTMAGDLPYKKELEHGVPFKLKVVADDGGLGSGVIAEEDIPEGAAVCEYTGEIILKREALMREKVYQSAGLFYLFDFHPDKMCDAAWCLDATRVGNVGRFINHRCGDSNLKVVKIWASSSFSQSDRVPGRICLVSKRKILKNESLTYDYGTFNSEEQELGIDMHKLVKCSCGSSSCRGWVF